MLRETGCIIPDLPEHPDLEDDIEALEADRDALIEIDGLLAYALTLDHWIHNLINMPCQSI